MDDCLARWKDSSKSDLLEWTVKTLSRQLGRCFFITLQTVISVWLNGDAFETRSSASFRGRQASERSFPDRSHLFGQWHSGRFWWRLPSPAKKEYNSIYSINGLILMDASHGVFSGYVPLIFRIYGIAQLVRLYHRAYGLLSLASWKRRHYKVSEIFWKEERQNTGSLHHTFGGSSLPVRKTPATPHWIYGHYQHGSDISMPYGLHKGNHVLCARCGAFEDGKAEK